jgi:CPA2 family monovalent cation:H+ antiporter-2
MALGAFVAGVLLAETEYGKAIEARIEPFKGLLLGIFFFTVGMNIDFREVVREPIWLLASVLFLIALKSLVVTVLARLFHVSWPGAIEAGLLLGSAGEFTFVILAMALALGLIEAHVSSFTIAVTSITMALTPLLSLAARYFTSLLPTHRAIDPELTARPPAGQKHALVVGYGRVGKVVCALLRQHKVPCIAIDLEASAVVQDRREGHTVYYGDAADPGFLKTCGIMDATGLIITIHTHDVIDGIVAHARAIRPDILIVSRARDADHARHLYAIGASDAVPETVEASLQLSEAALVGLGIARGPAIASIHEKRDEFRHALQKAAQEAGREEIHSVRAKTDRAR